MLRHPTYLQLLSLSIFQRNFVIVHIPTKFPNCPYPNEILYLSLFQQHFVVVHIQTIFFIVIIPTCFHCQLSNEFFSFSLFQENCVIVHNPTTYCHCPYYNNILPLCIATNFFKCSKGRNKQLGYILMLLWAMWCGFVIGSHGSNKKGSSNFAVTFFTLKCSIISSTL